MKVDINKQGERSRAINEAKTVFEWSIKLTSLQSALPGKKEKIKITNAKNIEKISEPILKILQKIIRKCHGQLYANKFNKLKKMERFRKTQTIKVHSRRDSEHKQTCIYYSNCNIKFKTFPQRKLHS